MAIFASRHTIYIEAESTEEAQEKIHALEHNSLNYPTEYIRTTEPPRKLQQDGTREGYASPVKRLLGSRPALLVGNALVPEDSITGVKVYPGILENTEHPDNLERLTDPVGIEIYTTAGILFSEHGNRALILLQELGLKHLLAELTKKKYEKDDDPS